MINILTTSLIASLICHSIDVLMRKGNLLHFIRHYFYTRKIDKINELHSKLTNDIMDRSHYLSSEEFSMRLKEVDEYKDSEIKKLHYLKPLVSCVICFASTYGAMTLVYLYFFGFISISMLPLSLLITVIFNDIVYDIRKAIQK